MIALGFQSRPRVRFSGSVNTVCDGNSLTFGLRASDRLTKSYPAVLATLPLMIGSTVMNIGISGQSSGDMLNNRADLNAAWALGKRNVLLACEGTNSIWGGKSGAQAASDLLTYVSTVKAEKNWQVVLVSTIPRYGVVSGDAYTQPNIEGYNAKINACNAALKTGWRGVADHFIDIQGAGSGFALPNYEAATFDATGLYVTESESGGTGRVHCSDAGYAEMARVIGLGLARLPARAP